MARAFIDIPDALLDAIDEGLHSGFLRVVDSRTETYDFVHEIVRMVLSGRLDAQPTHSPAPAARESLEQLYAGQEREHAGELAVQYSASASLPGAERRIDAPSSPASRPTSGSRGAGGLAFWRWRETSPPVMRRSEAGHPAPVGLARAQRMLFRPRRSARSAIAMMRDAREPVAIARFIARSAAALNNGADSAVWRPLVVQGIDLLGERAISHGRVSRCCWSDSPRSDPADHGGPLGKIDADALRIARTEGDEEDYARTLQPFQIRSQAETDALRQRIRTRRQPAAINRALMMIGADLMYTHGAFRDAVTILRVDRVRPGNRLDRHPR